MANSQFGRVVLPSLLLLVISITSFRYLLTVIPATSVQKGVWMNFTRDCPNLFNENYPLHRHVLYNSGSFGPTFCVIFAIFDAVVQDGAASRPFVINGLPFFGILGTFMLIESVRSHRPYPRAAVVLGTSIAQILTGAATLPYFWMLFLRDQYKHRVPSRISTVDAKAAIVGGILGYFLPSLLMLIYPTSLWINTLWQIYPLVTLISSKLSYLVFTEESSKAKNTAEGDNLIKKFYLTVTILATTLHIATWRLNLSNTFTEFIPMSPLAFDLNKGHTFETVSRVFLHWDAVFCFASALVAACWTAENVAEGIKILGWFVLSTPLAGSTAAFSGFSYWREQRIEESRTTKVE